MDLGRVSYLEVAFPGEGPGACELTFGLEAGLIVAVWDGWRERRLEAGEGEIIHYWVEIIGLERIMDRAILRAASAEPDCMRLAKSAKEYALVEEA